MTAARFPRAEYQRTGGAPAHQCSARSLVTRSSAGTPSIAAIAERASAPYRTSARDAATTGHVVRAA